MQLFSDMSNDVHDNVTPGPEFNQHNQIFHSKQITIDMLKMGVP
jgi:hypothetical protein